MAARSVFDISGHEWSIVNKEVNKLSSLVPSQTQTEVYRSKSCTPGAPRLPLSNPQIPAADTSEHLLEGDGCAETSYLMGLHL